MKTIEEKLSGGHPNSLGNTIKVVEEVLREPALFDALFQCYFSQDEVVRLRTSNAMKRIAKEKPELLLPYLDRFLHEISQIDQASTQWTLAQLFNILEKDLSPAQKKEAKKIMKKNIETHSDWIVLTQTMATLADWSRHDEELRGWLHKQAQRLVNDSRKAVAKKAQGIIEASENRA